MILTKTIQFEYGVSKEKKRTESFSYQEADKKRKSRGHNKTKQVQ
jgi:hypothetical protein